MRILIFNWRDIKNPSSGGAEVLTHEIAKRWVKWGHEVAQFSERYTDSKKFEVVDGIRIFRGGTSDIRKLNLPVHFAAYFWYMKNGKGNYDVIIDEIHGIPFFTPLYVKEKKVALICEVANELWKSMYGPIFGTLGRLVEIFYLRFVYKNIQFITISRSTKDELIKNKVSTDHIHIIPMGIRKSFMLKLSQKEKNPTLIFVGRLSKTKGIEDALYITAALVYEIPEINLWIVGRGELEYLNHLKEIAKTLKIDNRVKFFGFISERKKYELMSKAHIAVVPSIKEGWGLVVTEAGFCKTPSVVYDVPGLRDIIKDEVTGIVVEQTRKSMQHAIKKLFVDSALYKKVQAGAYHTAIQQDWDKTADKALNILQ